MTRKHYELLAAKIAEFTTPRSAQDMEALAVSLCASLHQDNPNFKAAVFLKACGFPIGGAA